MNLVGAALDDRIENAARSHAVFGAELILQQVELRHGLRRNIHLRTGVVVAIVHHAVDVEGVAVRPLAGHTRTNSLSHAAGGSDTSREQAEIVDSRSVDHLGSGSHSQIDGRPRVVGGLQLRGGCVDGRRRRRYFDGGADRAHLQRQVNRRGVVQLQIDTAGAGGRKPALGGRNSVGANRDVVQAILPFRVGHRSVFHARVPVGGGDVHTGNRSRAGVGNRPDKNGIGGLSV